MFSLKGLRNLWRFWEDGALAESDSEPEAAGRAPPVPAGARAQLQLKAFAMHSQRLGGTWGVPSCRGLMGLLS